MGRVMRWIVPLLAAGAAAAGLAFVPSEDAGISFIQSAPLPAAERLRFRAEMGAGWDVMPTHAGPQDRGMYDHPLYDVQLRPGGTMTVEAALIRDGRPVATARTAIPIEPDRRYFAHAAVQHDDPTAACMGCSEAVSAPIDGETGARPRRLWLYWSFNGISRPIMF